MKPIYTSFLFLSSGLLSTAAMAHGNHLPHAPVETHNFIAGVMHPFSGLDHLLALLLGALLLLQSRLPLMKSVTALMALMAMGAMSGQLFGAQAWVEAGILLTVVAMLVVLWVKPAQNTNHMQRLIFAICSTAMIVQGWAHGASLYVPTSTSTHYFEFIAGVISSSFVLLLTCLAIAHLIARKQHVSHAR